MTFLHLPATPEYPYNLKAADTAGTDNPQLLGYVAKCISAIRMHGWRNHGQKRKALPQLVLLSDHPAAKLHTFGNLFKGMKTPDAPLRIELTFNPEVEKLPPFFFASNTVTVMAFYGTPETATRMAAGIPQQARLYEAHLQDDGETYLLSYNIMAQLEQRPASDHPPNSVLA